MKDSELLQQISGVGQEIAQIAMCDCDGGKYDRFGADLQGRYV
jgi:hypothetical protein